MSGRCALKSFDGVPDAVRPTNDGTERQQARNRDAFPCRQQNKVKLHAWDVFPHNPSTQAFDG
jgi:hypothetical protein